MSSRRGHDGGYWLAKPASEITVADVIRAVEGPLASVRGGAPGGRRLRRRGPAAAARVDRVRTRLRSVVEQVTLADLAAGKLPARVSKLADEPESWTTR